MKKKILFILLFLVVVLVLGFLISANNPAKNKKKASKGEVTQVNTQTGNQTQTSIQLTDNDHLINFPANGSEVEKTAYLELVRKTAVDASELDISGCRPTPLVMKLKLGSEFTLINKDAVKRALVLDKDQIYQVAANSKTTVKASFGRGEGIYGFACDSSTKSVGLFVVVK